MKEVEFFQVGDWYFAASPPKKIQHWSAWCSKSKLTENSPVFESPDKQIWFQFGITKEEAVDKLKTEVLDGRGE